MDKYSNFLVNPKAIREVRAQTKNPIKKFFLWRYEKSIIKYWIKIIIDTSSTNNKYTKKQVILLLEKYEYDIIDVFVRLSWYHLVRVRGVAEDNFCRLTTDELAQLKNNYVSTVASGPIPEGGELPKYKKLDTEC